MKVILMKDVPKLGQKFDVKDVSGGHAQNLLIPNGSAVAATKEALKRAEAARLKQEGERKVREDLIAKNISDLDGMTLEMAGKVNEKGHLFAGLHREAVAAEIEKQTKLQLDPSFIQLEHPIKEAGEHDITVTGAGKTAKFKLVVTAE